MMETTRLLSSVEPPILEALIHQRPPLGPLDSQTGTISTPALIPMPLATRSTRFVLLEQALLHQQRDQV